MLNGWAAIIEIAEATASVRLHNSDESEYATLWSATVPWDEPEVFYGAWTEWTWSAGDTAGNFYLVYNVAQYDQPGEESQFGVVGLFDADSGTSVPEPGSGALGLLSLGALGWGRRRGFLRRRS